jgi:DNA polymerase elongation subunit (family B)
LLANAGYGAFARKEFAYSDYRVSEIITGYGRLIHKQMEKIGFERYGFQTVFGFTDSIFIRHARADNTITSIDSSKQHISQFLEDCQNQLNVKIEHKILYLIWPL